MGQYHIPVNLTKREFIDPHKLGCGLKLWEQIANNPGTGAALLILTACSNGRGGGDLDPVANFIAEGSRMIPAGTGAIGVEKVKPDKVNGVIGRWAGDRIVVVGDYAKRTDLAEHLRADLLYGKCQNETDLVYNDIEEGAAYRDGTGGENHGKWAHYVETKSAPFKDISELVCAVIEKEMEGKYTGDGWRTFEETNK